MIVVDYKFFWHSVGFLPPLIPPWKGGKKESSSLPFTRLFLECSEELIKSKKKESSSLPFTRGGLGWGNAVSNGK
jgi:hypothetical protein